MFLSKKLKEEKGQIADIIMFLIFISFVTFFIIGYASMQIFFKTQEIVDNIVKSEVEIVRTKGIFTTDEYKEFLKRITRYGNFDIYLTLEKQDNAGNRVNWYRNSDILDQPLKVGDFIKIVVESKQAPLFSEILARNFMFSYRNEKSTFRMQSLCSGMVCVDGYIRGIEVQNIIERYCIDGSPIRVSVLTQANIEAKHAATEYSFSNPYDAKTAMNTENYIKEEGRFFMYLERDNNSTNKIKSISISELNVNDLK